MMRTGIEVMICSYNGAERIQAVFEALAAQTLPACDWSVVLVDNASTDGTAARALGAWPRTDVPFRVVHEPTQGVRMARMRALTEASREFVCFCDDDNLLAPDYLERAVQLMGQMPLVGALGGKGVASTERPVPEWFGAAALGYAVGHQAEVEGEVAPSRGYLYTAGMVLRSSAWDQLSRTGYKLRLMGRQGGRLTSGEDNEMCLLLSLMGWKLHYSPRLVFQHRIGPRRLEEEYCRALHRGFGEAMTLLNPYRDFVLGRATPQSWRRCAAFRLAQSWLVRLSVLVGRRPERAALNARTIRREMAVGFSEACRVNYRGRGLFELYADLARWLQAAKVSAPASPSPQPGTARRIATSLSWLLADRGMRLAGSFLVGLWLARYLGPSDFGLFSVATAATFFGVVATQLGMDGLVQRELVRRPEAAGVILGTVTGLGLAVAAAAWGVIALLSFTVVQDPEMRSVLLWMGLLVVPQALVGWEYLFQARSDLRPVVIGQNSCFAVCLASRALLIIGHAPVVAFAVVAVAERALGAWVVVRWGAHRHPTGRLSFDPALARTIMAEAWPVWISALLTTTYLKFDQILIVHWSGSAAAGTYAAATRFSELWWSISTIVATAVLPDLVRASHRSQRQYWAIMQKYFDASAALSVLAAVTMTLLAPVLVRLFYGARYSGAAGILAVQFWSAVFIFLSVARGRHLVASGRRLVELWFALGGVALNLSANAVLIPRFGAQGAAWAGLLTHAFVSLALPWCFENTREIVRMQLSALMFPVRAPALWREFRLRPKPVPA